MAIEMEAAEWAALNDRQKSQATDLAEIALEYGMFDQTTGANGAHYAPAAKNPFKSEGLNCQNCIFFNELNNQCQIVSGSIEPDAVCKLWIIPESALGIKPSTPITSRAELATMSAEEIMAAKNQGRLDTLLGK